MVETADGLLLRLATEPRHGLCSSGMSGSGGGVLKGWQSQDEGGHSLKARNTAEARKSPRGPPQLMIVNLSLPCRSCMPPEDCLRRFCELLRNNQTRWGCQDHQCSDRHVMLLTSVSKIMWLTV